MNSISPAAGVSVVIPTYNYARFLSFAIDSVLRQSHPAVEVIVVDDGSTDDTKKVAAAYGDKIRYIFQANSGLSAARNTGITAARFEFIALLDSDDEWHPDFLATGLRLFSELPADFGLVASSVRYIDAQGAPLPETRNSYPLAGEVTAADILCSTRFPSNGVLVRKSAFAECGLFDTSLRSTEDRDMWVRIAGRYRVHFNPERLALVRRHGPSMISNVERMRTNMRQVIRKAYANQAVPRWRFWFWLKVLAVYYYQVALMYGGSRRPWRASVELVRSLAIWPFWLAPREINVTVPLVRLRALLAIFRNSFGGTPPKPGIPAPSKPS